MITHVTIHTAPQPTRATGLYALKPWFTGRLTFVVNAAVARQMSPDTFTVAGAGASRRNGGPRGKTERCLFLALAATFPILMPFLAVSL
ncbi:MAG: hypothetical protein ACXWZR_07565 [Mycobacterium sp.]